MRNTNTKYILWGYPLSHTLPEAMAIKLCVGTLRQCALVEKKYVATHKMLTLKKGVSVSPSSLSDYIQDPFEEGATHD